jgi:hypothetical protein
MRSSTAAASSIGRVSAAMILTPEQTKKSTPCSVHPQFGDE